MSWVAVAVAAAGVLGAGASVYGAGEQKKAAGSASDVQLRMLQLQQNKLQPYSQAGIPATAGLNYGLGTNATTGFDPNAPLMRAFGMQDFLQSPGYQFNLSQGMDAINKQAASRGNFYAPQTLQDIGRFSQGLASNEWNTERNAFMNQQQAQFQRLLGLSQIGENAAAGQGSGAITTGGLIGNNLTSAGAAQAGGVMGGANALSGIPISILLANSLKTNQTPTYNQTPYTGSS